MDSPADVQALASELYANRREYLLRIATRNSLNRDDAEESLQEAFIAFMRRYEPGGEAHPLAWLTLTLKRECWQRQRRHHHERRVPEPPGHAKDLQGFALNSIPDPGQDLREAAELSERVAEARTQLAQLKADERRALTLVAFGYSYREIGEITGWTYTKVNRCVAEGRERLRELAAKAEPRR